jgi:hypothetical protein
MTEPFDALEAELEALQPRQPSPQLQRRIAERLEHVPLSWKTRFAWSVVLASGIAAGVSLAVFLWRPKPQTSQPEIVREKPPAPIPPTVAVDNRLPTVGAYQQALAESPEAFEALLDQHARTCALSVGQRRSAILMTPYSIQPE